MSAAPPFPGAIVEFLGAPTPRAWVDAAVEAFPGLLVDHANCEMKAASTALAMMYRYPEHDGLVDRMSRLAREELRHFEQVRKLMRERGVAWRKTSASRYASGLAAEVASSEPDRLVDRLIVGAFIEARSCERFALLVPRLDEGLSRFYAGLLASEARHFEHYLELARRHGGAMSAAELDGRIEAVRRTENALVTGPDAALRFHSGTPRAAASPRTDAGGDATVAG